MARLDLGDGLVLYRGQRQCWQLRPSIGRFETPAEEVDEERVRRDERRLLREFSNRARPCLENALRGPALHRLMVAQHYGVPTRLLDWSESALVALFFAVEGKRMMCDAPVVYAYRSPPVRVTNDGYLSVTEAVDGLASRITDDPFLDAETVITHWSEHPFPDGHDHLVGRNPDGDDGVVRASYGGLDRGGASGGVGSSVDAGAGAGGAARQAEDRGGRGGPGLSGREGTQVADKRISTTR